MARRGIGSGDRNIVQRVLGQVGSSPVIGPAIGGEIVGPDIIAGDNMSGGDKGDSGVEMMPGAVVINFSFTADFPEEQVMDRGGHGIGGADGVLSLKIGQTREAGKVKINAGCPVQGEDDGLFFFLGGEAQIDI